MDFYDRFIKLCAEKGVKPSPMAESIGIQKTAVSNWKTRKTKPTAVNLQKIADYFGVTVEYLKNGTVDKKEKTTINPDVTDDDIKFALFDGDIDEITDEMYEEVKAFAQFVKNKHKKD